MTSPTGYIRSRTTRERSIDRAWAVLQAAARRGRWLAAGDIAEAAEASRSVVKRLLQAGRDAGWIEISHEIRDHETPDARGAVRTPLYRLTAAAPDTAPALRLTDATHVEPVAHGAMSGESLRQLRLESGWTLVETAERIGVADTRTVRRYETLATLPGTVSDRVGELLADATQAGRRRQ
jgi:hypothetical protein